MEVRIDLTEVYIGKVAKGDKILVELPALGIEKIAIVSSVGQTVNSYNRAFQVIASIENGNDNIKPNLLAKAKITKESIPDALVIPTSLVQESSKGYFVFTAQIDSLSNAVIAVKKTIDISESYAGQVVVRAGLKAGDLIINEGFRNVLDGQIIQILK